MKKKNISHQYGKNLLHKEHNITQESIKFKTMTNLDI